MKQMENIRCILRACELFAQMPSGAGWVTPQEIINWSGVKHSTVYRSLTKLENLGLFHVEEYTCRKIKCRRYRISLKGIDFLKQWDVIPF